MTGLLEMLSSDNASTPLLMQARTWPASTSFARCGCTAFEYSSTLDAWDALRRPRGTLRRCRNRSATSPSSGMAWATLARIAEEQQEADRPERR